MSASDSYTAKQFYNFEVGSSSSNTIDNMKIGLMYVSDYGFATSNSYWTKTLYDYESSNAYKSDWMYSGLVEWTISRYTVSSKRAYLVSSAGWVNGGGYLDSAHTVRPVFFLISSTTYVSGSGTSSDPIRIQ